MTEAEAIELLKAEQSNTDYEVAHFNADIVLCELLRVLGYSKVVKEWEKVPKWYS